MSHEKCPCFGIGTESVEMAGLNLPMKLPVYQCEMTTTLAARLRALPDGAMFADNFTTTTASGLSRALVGPDLEPVNPHVCTHRRCQDMCKPAFVSLVTDLHLGPVLPLQAVVFVSLNLPDLAAA